MSELNADEFDNDYWFEMYQGQCAATDEWAKKYRDEVERKADATLLARCAELQRIAEVANAMVGKERVRYESTFPAPAATLGRKVLWRSADVRMVFEGMEEAA